MPWPLSVPAGLPYPALPVLVSSGLSMGLGICQGTREDPPGASINRGVLDSRADDAKAIPAINSLLEVPAFSPQAL